MAEVELGDQPSLHAEVDYGETRFEHVVEAVAVRCQHWQAQDTLLVSAAVGLLLVGVGR